MIDSVKLLGRTYAAQDGKIWMGLSGTGVELEYSGKKLSVTLRGDCSDTDKMPRIGVYVAIFPSQSSFNPSFIVAS